VEIVKIANEFKVPIVPRAGATGIADGAVPLRKGICLDVKRMNEILEIDEVNMTVTVQPGVGLMELNKVLGRLGLQYTDAPASYPMAYVGGRIGTSGISFLVGYGNPNDLVISMEVVLPTGKVVRVGGGGARKCRKSSSGFRLKELFMGHQGTLGITTEAILHIYKKIRCECPAVFGFGTTEEAWNYVLDVTSLGLRSLTGAVMMDAEKIEFFRRSMEAFANVPKEIRSTALVVFHGFEGEVNAGRDIAFERAMNGHKGHYLGDMISNGGWATRNELYQIPHGGRTPAGEVKLMSWHAEDAGIPNGAVLQTRKKWHEIMKRYIDKYEGFFDDWGIATFTSNPRFGDHYFGMDIGFEELNATAEHWQEFNRMESELSEVAIDEGGTVSASHGACRPGNVEIACHKELAEGSFDLMKQIKKMLDPNNIMNPGKYLLDEAYE
jgi:glycolate oxidase